MNDWDQKPHQNEDDIEKRYPSVFSDTDSPPEKEDPLKDFPPGKLEPPPPSSFSFLKPTPEEGVKELPKESTDPASPYPFYHSPDPKEAEDGFSNPASNAAPSGQGIDPSRDISSQSGATGSPQAPDPLNTPPYATPSYPTYPFGAAESKYTPAEIPGAPADSGQAPTGAIPPFAPPPQPYGQQPPQPSYPGMPPQSAAYPPAPGQPYAAPYGGYPYAQQNPPGTMPYGAAPNQPQAAPPSYETPAYSSYGAVQEPETKKPKRKNAGLIVFIILLVAAILTAAGFIIYGFVDNGFSSSTSERSNTASVASGGTASGPKIEVQDPGAGAAGLSYAEVAQKIKPSVVGIVIYQSDSGASSVYGEGSGIVMNTEGYIITCAHVISGMENNKIMIVLESGKEIPAEIVAYDARTDIGVLKASTSDSLTPATFVSTDNLQVGDQVMAVGCPGGMEFYGSVTDGIISAIDRPINSQIGYTMRCIQHTAAINPGNSGGALVNMAGEVIGINSSKISSAEYEGMGFAIPMSSAQKVIDDLIQYGYVQNRSKLGITFLPTSSDQYYSMLVQLAELPAGSLYINEISEDSDLVNYDVKKGDLIVGVNGSDLNKSQDLLDVIEGSNPGDTITLKICRITGNSASNIKTFEVTCKLAEDKGTTAVASQAPQSEDAPF